MLQTTASPETKQACLVKLAIASSSPLKNAACMSAMNFAYV